ncbi:bifunctional riboflavin kinase/FAD synthetase [Legionella oakridgensis]|uniref:Riboflavin biosynthesis protein n=2 Tax=Legionella oakridgensis TaxID=29423 RepID=W0BDL0_9GAMM|nr:bifunctional riboflavin kinase/FAD synthetase [Legionella oakridgensis]AHE66722.1 riboflavin kinase/FMN adenylyltransferase [Legionella oakridgensis ATCC 33761 = DSM 21215]ETO93589.1 FMN adenylyltransferase/riboflavin kinase [Legionella oakridgensis RV-2-2007]KTD38094.1 riboflavin biosynthesis protein RibF (riboflavin kinase/FMN adenylyltransferase) [Legionella oakridgensis]STY19854.1 riboflavin biosynthesis protein RibF (riboflavin kinase/FMN adenylyltransferase) [Legionella longbeachae]
MKLLRGVQNIPAFSAGTVATIGNFDGVHLGHQALLQQARAQADSMQLPLLLVLFEPQPNEYFHGSQAPARLSSLREKLHILRQFRVDFVICLKFNQTLSSMSPVEFAKRIIFSLLNVKLLLIGHDFHFGSKRAGDVKLLTEIASQQASTVQIFSDFTMSDERVSSTKIRQALHDNCLQRAAKLLGRPYSLCGRVVKGDGRGRQWNIPTANLGMHRPNLPLKGVFCVQVKRQGRPILAGVANLGCRPTIGGSKNVLEVHLLNFNESLYGELLEIFFLHKLREEVKFSSLEALLAQIHDDIAAAKRYFDENNKHLIVAE